MNQELATKVQQMQTKKNKYADEKMRKLNHVLYALPKTRPKPKKREANNSKQNKDLPDVKNKHNYINLLTELKHVKEKLKRSKS